MSRPYSGTTSTIEVGSDSLTLQSEVVGDPPVVATTVFFRGRIINQRRTSLADAVRRWPDEDIPGVIRKVHKSAEARVRGLLREKAASGPRDEERKVSPIALLFIRAVHAYAEGDGNSALGVLEALRAMDPSDERIKRSLKSLQAEVGS